MVDELDPDWNCKWWYHDTIKPLQEYAHSQGQKFVWALGGWSDLKRTITDAQVCLTKPSVHPG